NAQYRPTPHPPASSQHGRLGYGHACNDRLSNADFSNPQGFSRVCFHAASLVLPRVVEPPRRARCRELGLRHPRATAAIARVDIAKCAAFDTDEQATSLLFLRFTPMGRGMYER